MAEPSTYDEIVSQQLDTIRRDGNQRDNLKVLSAGLLLFLEFGF